jgi:hypothetical protein
VKLLQLSRVDPNDVKELWRAFQMVLDSLRGIREEDNRVYQEEVATYTKQLKTLESSLESANSEKLLSDAQVNQVLIPNRDTLTQSLRSVRKDITKTKDSIKELDENYLKSDGEMKKKVKNLADLIAAVDRAIQVLSAFQSTATPESSFLETESEKQIAEDLRNGMQLVGSEAQKVLMNLLLMKMTVDQSGGNQPEFDAKASAQKIIDLLVQLRAQLTSQRIRLLGEIELADTAHSNESEMLYKLLEDYEKVEAGLVAALDLVKSKTLSFPG